ncbi:hypothetical protein ACVWXD_000899 [Pseudomonas sp. TE3911]
MAGFRAASQPSAGQACSPQRLCSPSGIGSTQRACSPQQTTPLVLVEESRRVCGGCAFCGEPAVCGEFSFCGEQALYGGFACCSEQACPALGREAAPIQSPRFSRQNPMAGFRAASQPSAGQACSPQKSCVRHSGIGSPQTARSPQQTNPPVRLEESRLFCGDCTFCGEPAVCGVWCVVTLLFVVRQQCVVGSFFVVSRLALRWGAKRPQSSRRVSPGRTQWPVLGPLRSPAQGKPAHHRKVVFAIRYRLTAKSLFTSTIDPTRAS